MAEKIIHKLIVQHLRCGRLGDLVLCWNNMFEHQTSQIENVDFDVSINAVNCPKCIELWRLGIYQ